MKYKKSQGLSTTVIIIAVLALLVLVVLAVIFTGGISRFQTGLTDCKARGGTKCINESKGETCGEGEIPVPAICKGDLKCCIPTG